jgi:hypothetical protein
MAQVRVSKHSALARSASLTCKKITGKLQARLKHILPALTVDALQA